MQSHRSRHLRRGVALATSAVLHVCAGLILLAIVSGRHSADSGALARPAQQVEISLLEAAGGPDAETRVEKPPPSADKRRRIVHRPTGTLPSPLTASVEGRPAESANATFPRAPGSSNPAGDSALFPPLAEARRSAVGRKSDFSFDGLGEEAKQRVDAMPNPQEDLERLLVPAPELTGRWRALSEVRAATERHANAVENLRLGRAHPLHFDYLREARDLILADADRFADQLALGPQETIAGWARGYLDRVQELGRTEARDQPPIPEDPAGGHRPDLLGAYNEAQLQAEAGASRRVAYVCLGVAPHHPVVVTLRRSSGNAGLDKLAVESFRVASGNRPVADDVRPGLACYFVSISAYRMSPLPSLSFGWRNGRPQLIHPFARKTNVAVELESVDYGPGPGPPSLLRRPN